MNTILKTGIFILLLILVFSLGFAAYIVFSPNDTCFRIPDATNPDNVFICFDSETLQRYMVLESKQ